MSGRRPYVRPMGGWWKANPWYREYMLHEATALFVAAYGLFLLYGLVCLARGEVAWTGWLALARSPGALIASALVFGAFVYHAWTWFQIMPRTLPPVVVMHKRQSPGTIVAAGLVAAVVCNLCLFGLFARFVR